MSLDIALFPHVGDAITALTNESEWAEVGDTVADVVVACKDAIESWYSDMLIGQVAQFVMVAPSGWLELDGATYAQVDYPELAAKIPAGWITGDNFTLPDVEEIFFSGVGSGGTVGATGGSNTHVLTESEMPTHSHTYTFPVVAPDTISAGSPTPSVATVTPGTPTSSAGSDNAHENRPAFVSLVVAVFAGRE